MKRNVSGFTAQCDSRPIQSFMNPIVQLNPYGGHTFTNIEQKIVV